MPVKFPWMSSTLRRSQRWRNLWERPVSAASSCCFWQRCPKGRLKRAFRSWYLRLTRWLSWHLGRTTFCKSPKKRWVYGDDDPKWLIYPPWLSLHRMPLVWCYNVPPPTTSKGDIDIIQGETTLSSFLWRCFSCGATACCGSLFSCVQTHPPGTHGSRTHHKVIWSIWVKIEHLGTQMHALFSDVFSIYIYMYIYIYI